MWLWLCSVNGVVGSGLSAGVCFCADMVMMMMMMMMCVCVCFVYCGEFVVEEFLHLIDPGQDHGHQDPNERRYPNNPHQDVKEPRYCSVVLRHGCSYGTR